MSIAIINRNQSYREIAQTLSIRRRSIYDIILNHPNITCQEIAEQYVRPINEVTGRVTELKKMILITETGTKKSRWSNKNTTMYRVVQPEEKVDFINRRFVELREKKDQLINDRNLGLSTYTLAYIKKELIKINQEIKDLEQIQD